MQSFMKLRSQCIFYQTSLYYICLDDISTVASRVSRENDRNEKLHKHLIESNLINARTRGSSGVDGKDFHLGTVISKNGYHKGRMARDYRYDKILRNRSIGRPGSGLLLRGCFFPIQKLLNQVKGDLQGE